MSAGNEDRAPRRISLQDGRRLGWYEFGDEAGEPCLFLPGAATSGRAGLALDRAATSTGIRLISIDRPGLGTSDPAHPRPLADWADDIRELIDQLGLDRVGVLGHSAGGAFALAVSCRLADRVSKTVIGAGSGPYSEGWFREAAKMSRIARGYYWLALRTPGLFGALLKSSTPRSEKGIDRTMSMITRGKSPDALFARTHSDETRVSLEAAADGFRQGSQGPTNDIRLVCLPWGFQLEEVGGRVGWWHGEQDANVRAAAGRAIAARLPHVTTHFIDGGHYLLFDEADAVMASLRHR